jgi:hypothetical protein
MFKWGLPRFIHVINFYIATAYAKSTLMSSTQRDEGRQGETNNKLSNVIPEFVQAYAGRWRRVTRPYRLKVKVPHFLGFLYREEFGELLVQTPVGLGEARNAP